MLDVIRRCPNLIFQLLTKRPENFTERLTAVMKHIENSSENHTSRGASLHLWALDWVVGQKVPSHIWIGASVENQPEADRRIPELLKIPAAVRFLSFEPLLEDIDFSRFTPWLPAHPQYNASECVQWVIVGGESGPHARPCNADWIRSVVSQCKDASVPCFVKQLGAKITVPHPQFGEWDNWHVKVKDRKGADPSEWPQDLQVRQFPEGAQ
jgi:protein gp37